MSEPCWVPKCDGRHDRFMHPRHNHKPPPLGDPRRNEPVTTCSECGTEMVRNAHPKGYWVGWTSGADQDGDERE